MTPYRPLNAGAQTAPAPQLLTTLTQSTPLPSEPNRASTPRRHRHSTSVDSADTTDLTTVIRSVLGRMKPDVAAASELEFSNFVHWIGFSESSTAALQLIGLPDATLTTLITAYDEHLWFRWVFGEERVLRIERLRSLLNSVRTACPRSRIEILDVAHLHTLWMRLSTAPGPPAVRSHTQAVVALLISPQLALRQIAAVTQANCHTEGFLTSSASEMSSAVVIRVGTTTSAALEEWRRHLPPGDEGLLFLDRRRGSKPPIRRVQGLARLVSELTPLLGRPVDAERIQAAACVEVRLRGLQPWQLVMPATGLSG